MTADMTEKANPAPEFPGSISQRRIIKTMPANPKVRATTFLTLSFSSVMKWANTMVKRGLMLKITAAVDALDPSTPN